jgi:hypothetical protein
MSVSEATGARRDKVTMLTPQEQYWRAVVEAGRNDLLPDGHTHAEPKPTRGRPAADGVGDVSRFGRWFPLLRPRVG